MALLFAIYPLSGIIKGFLGYYGVDLPVDLTALCAALLTLHMGYLLLWRGSGVRLSPRYGPSVVALLLFYGWMLFTLLYTPSEEYSFVKVQNFLTCMIGFLYPLCCRSLDPKRVLLWMALITPIISVQFVRLLYSNYVAGSDELFHDGLLKNYLALSLHCGFYALALMDVPGVLGSTAGRSLLGFGGLGLMLLMGGRGPLLFLLLLGAMLLPGKVASMSGDRLARSLLRGGVALVLVVAVGFGAFTVFGEEVTALFDRSIGRLALMVTGLFDSESHDMGESANFRVEQFHFSLQLISRDLPTSLVGYGIGSYGVLESWVDDRSYPHNILLEVLVELGAVGMVLLMAFFILCLLPARGASPVGRVLPIYMLMNALKSSSIVDTRLLFATLGMYLAWAGAGAVAGAATGGEEVDQSYNEIPGREGPIPFPGHVGVAYGKSRSPVLRPLS